MRLIRPATSEEFSLAVAIDEDACQLLEGFGLPLSFAPDHPFVVSEWARWRRCAEAGSMFFALEAETVVGFAALERLEGVAHLEQLSVRVSQGRRGVGTALLKTALDWAAGPLTLTTYRHVPWNAPWYERMGFEVLPPVAWSSAVQARMDEERAALPAPEQRVAMLHRG